MFDKKELSIILSRFLHALKNKYYSRIIWTFMSPGFRLLGLLCLVLALPILWILKPVFWLKVGKLSNVRIGHLAMNTDLFLRRRQLGIYPDGPFYCFICDPTQIANRQLLIMWKRVLPICESRCLSLMFVGMLPILKRTPFYQDLPFDDDEHYENNEYCQFNNAKPSISFTPNEIEKGRKLLKQMNVDLDKDKFVCIFARDDAYLKKTVPYINWDYHSCKNSDINSLIKTAKYLIEKGFVVIRIGSVVNKPINFSHKKMIDYPYSGHQSDFLDIFLQAHCKFIISAGNSGATDIGTIFDKPVLFVDHTYYGVDPFPKNSLYTPKKYKYSNTNDYLHFTDLGLEDALNLGHTLYTITDLGLEATPGNPEDFLETTKEMLDRVEGRFKYSPEDERLIQAYYKLWDKSDVKETVPKRPIGIAWLKKNQSLYF